MSGGVSDDDEVTIWAGRLRPSPLPPPEHTVVRTRRSARRPDPLDTSAVEGRLVRVPSLEAADTYGPRVPQPAIAVRAAPPVRTPLPPFDVSDSATARRCRDRRRALVFVAVGAVLGALAVAAIAWIILLPT